MAYTALGNAIFGVDEPITSATGIALRDNPLAIAEGSDAAPRVSSAAFALVADSTASATGGAGGQELAAFDLGEAREISVLYHISISLNITSESGTSSIDLQASTDDVTYTTLETLLTSSGAIKARTAMALHSEIGGTAYRYFRIIAQGDNDHDISGSAFLMCAGAA